MTINNSSPSPSTPIAAAAPAPARLVEPHTKNTISDTEAQVLAGQIKAERDSGKLAPEAATSVLNELRIPADQQGPDTRTPDQKQLDTLHPPAKDSEYVIRYGLAAQAMPMTPELKQFDQSARAWLAGAEFDRMTGNILVTTIDRVAHQTQTMTEDQLQFYGESQYALLEKSYGAKLEEKLQAAGRMVQEIEKKHPGLNNVLKRVGDSALVASMLIAQAEIYWARRGKR